MHRAHSLVWLSGLLLACAVPTPPPDCKEGERRCDSTGMMEIVCLRDANGLLRFGHPVICPSGARCENGACQNPCGACLTPPGPCHRNPGSCWDGKCRYDFLADGERCDDEDACTSDDVCAAGQCKGRPQACAQAPASVCKDALTLTAYASPGNCSEGKCIYPAADVPCPSGCASGACKGDPCVNIKCESPPNVQCYKVPGICSSGKCTYIPNVAGTCDDGNPCTRSDKCDAGGTCAGTSYVCNDNRPCTIDVCNGKGGCAFEVDGSSCLINGTCYLKGTLKPGNACEHCNPAMSPSFWSTASGTTLHGWSFDDGTLQGFTVAPTTSPVRWQVDSKRADAGSYSLYFGDIATHTYQETGKAVSGQVTSPTVNLPGGAGKLCVHFRMFKWTEPSTSFDQIKVTVLPAGTDIFLSSAEPRNATTADATGTTYSFRSFAAQIPQGLAGSSVQLRFDFDSKDAVGNSTEGVYIDTVQVLTGCAP